MRIRIETVFDPKTETRDAARQRAREAAVAQCNLHVVAESCAPQGPVHPEGVDPAQEPQLLVTEWDFF